MFEYFKSFSNQLLDLVIITAMEFLHIHHSRYTILLSRRLLLRGTPKTKCIIKYLSSCLIQQAHSFTLCISSPLNICYSPYPRSACYHNQRNVAYLSQQLQLYYFLLLLWYFLLLLCYYLHHFLSFLLYLHLLLHSLLTLPSYSFPSLLSYQQLL